MKLMSLKSFTMSASLLVLAACSVGPNYNTPQSTVKDEWSASADTQKRISQDQIQAEWWTIFKDPLLEKYIQAAMQNNHDVEIALANVRRARALRKESGAAFFPQIDATGAAERFKSDSDSSGSDISSLYDVGFDATWEIDIFGGTRRSTEAANARVGSAVADYRAALLAVMSEVARTYYEARGLQKRIAITEENSELLRKTSDLIATRLEVGEASDFDASRALGEYQLTRARIPNLNADLRASIFNLSVLLGQPPEYLLSEMQQVKPLPAPPDIVPVGLRSEILRRRPDIQFAERELAANTADIGVATSDLFPRFFLTGDIGTQARVFGDLFSGGLWSLGSLIQWSVFQGGALQARVETQEAETQAALAQYEQSVLEALRDVETALTRYGEELETRRRLEEGVKSRRTSVNLARELFDSGEEDYLSVLDSERELTSSEDQLVVSETQSIIKLIALYTALGGGWDVYENPQKQP